MNSEKSSKHDKPVMPGNVLKEQFMKPKGMTVNDISKLLSMPERHVNQILTGRRAITADTAIRLSHLFNTKPEFWTDLQSQYDIYVAKQKFEEIFTEDALLSKIFVHNPNDKIIKLVMTDRKEAEAFFKSNLNPVLVDQLDWDTLLLEGSHFIDDTFSLSESDILFSVCFNDSDIRCYLYILFEHQSVPDKWMRFRLYKYKSRIWDDSFKNYPKQKYLSPIVSVVLYIGEKNWLYSNNFSDLIHPSPLDNELIPKFKHILLDYSDKSKAVKGNTKMQIAQLLIQAKYHSHFTDIIQLLEKLFRQLPYGPGINYRQAFIIYIAVTQKKDDVLVFLEKVKKQPDQKGGNMLTAREEWILEGKMEGKMEGQISIIDNLVKSGIDWNLIANATGLDQKGFEEMRLEYQHLCSKPDVNQKSMQYGTTYIKSDELKFR
ncbi:Transposase (putative), YhgA-like protein [Candidatus Magnetomorum sp. HK-1]|nr:Transposase (putative), YhgA-like protein [Candidatus Magnetomorum sp. HK-1]